MDQATTGAGRGLEAGTWAQRHPALQPALPPSPSLPRHGRLNHPVPERLSVVLSPRRQLGCVEGGVRAGRDRGGREEPQQPPAATASTCPSSQMCIYWPAATTARRLLHLDLCMYGGGGREFWTRGGTTGSSWRGGLGIEQKKWDEEEGLRRARRRRKKR